MTDQLFARTPRPPYYAVIFSSKMINTDRDYEALAEKMVTLAKDQPGFLGYESARSTTGFGITVSFWANEESIAEWKQHAEHRIAQERGRTDWYEHYEVRVAKVERGYAGP